MSCRSPPSCSGLMYGSVPTSSPAKVIDATSCVVVGKRTPEKDKYSAVTLGFGEVKEKALSKARIGASKKANSPLRRHMKEFRGTPEEIASLNVGDAVKVDLIKDGDHDVLDISVALPEGNT